MSTKRRLYIKIGPCLNNIVPSNSDLLSDILYVNDDSHPVLISNEHFTGHAVFRVQNYSGHTPMNRAGKSLPIISDSAYFDDRARQFSLQIEGRFHHAWSGDDILFGAFLDKAIEIPLGASIALGIAHWVDPAVGGDLRCKKPYLCSPLLCGMNVVSVRSSPKITSEPSSLAMPRPLPLPLWKWGGAKYLFENLLDSPLQTTSSLSSLSQAQDSKKTYDVILTSHSTSNGTSHLSSGKVNIQSSDSESTTPDSSSPSPSDPATLKLSKQRSKFRREYFLDEKNRKKFTFHPSNAYGFEFSSSYADLNTMKLKMGITIDLDKYIKQPLVYEARTRDGQVVFFRLEVGLH